MFTYFFRAISTSELFQQVYTLENIRYRRILNHLTKRKTFITERKASTCSLVRSEEVLFKYETDLLRVVEYDKIFDQLIEMFPSLEKVRLSSTKHEGVFIDYFPTNLIILEIESHLPQYHILEEFKDHIVQEVTGFPEFYSRNILKKIEGNSIKEKNLTKSLFY